MINKALGEYSHTRSPNATSLSGSGCTGDDKRKYHSATRTPHGGEAKRIASRRYYETMRDTYLDMCFKKHCVFRRGDHKHRVGAIKVNILWLAIAAEIITGTADPVQANCFELHS